MITFDHVSQQFRSSKGGKEFVKGSTIDEFQMSEACSPSDLVDKLRESYKETNESIVRHIMADKNSSAVLVVYSDIEGNPYITRREFDINESDEVGHFGSSTIAF